MEWISSLLQSKSQSYAFHTLLIEQNVNHELPNHGIKELPNLEFKLICADSILRLQPEHKDSEPDQITIPLPNIQQDDFQAHIHDYFSASNPKTKMIVIEKLKTMVGKMVLNMRPKSKKS